MIDLHCHILPGLDDGATDLGVSLDMARAFVEDGVSVVACTPHILPGLYHNTGPAIREAVEDLQQHLDQEEISLTLTTGSDAHMTPDFLAGLQSGKVLSLADTRYVLVEPPHHTAPPQLEEFFFKLLVGGYVPILTHPERLSWVQSRYGVIQRLVQAGVWMQITAGSLTGAFGRTALYSAERMMQEGCVHIIATDAHDATRRLPNLAAGRAAAARLVGDEEAEHLTMTRPAGVLRDDPPSDLPLPVPAVGSSGGSHGNDATRQQPRVRAVGQDRDDEPAAGGMRGFADRLRRLLG